MDELLPCPFCGGETHIKSWLPCDGYMGESARYKARCEDCYACTDDVDTKQRAIDLWNTRTPKERGGEK